MAKCLVRIVNIVLMAVAIKTQTRDQNQKADKADDRGVPGNGVHDMTDI